MVRSGDLGLLLLLARFDPLSFSWALARLRRLDFFILLARFEALEF